MDPYMCSCISCLTLKERTGINYLIKLGSSTIVGLLYDGTSLSFINGLDLLLLHELIMKDVKKAIDRLTKMSFL